MMTKGGHLARTIDPSLVLVQPRKTRHFITERLLMGRKESNKQTKGDPKGHYYYPILTQIMNYFSFTFHSVRFDVCSCQKVNGFIYCLLL